MKEKSPQEKNAAERQVSLITEALSKAADNKGVWLNEQGKQYPRFLPKGSGSESVQCPRDGIKLRQERIFYKSLHVI